MYFSSDADEILEAVDAPEHVGIDDANRSLLEAQPQGIPAPDDGATATTISFIEVGITRKSDDDLFTSSETNIAMEKLSRLRWLSETD